MILLEVVSTYQDALRDPRYLDGWVLAGGMSLQLYFHIAVTARSLSPRAAARWRRFHILLGYLLIPTFILHCDYAFPDTALEWALWSCFVFISLSGLFGIYIAWSLKSRDATVQSVGFDRIPVRRAELARDLHAIVHTAHPAAASTALPPPPYDAWIRELYADCLRDFFAKRPSLPGRLIGARHRLNRVMDAIDNLSGFVDEPSQKKLALIKSLVVEKDRLDAAHVALGLSRGWLLIHVPATYMLIVLTVVHVLVVYAFSSAAW